LLTILKILLPLSVQTPALNPYGVLFARSIDQRNLPTFA